MAVGGWRLGWKLLIYLQDMVKFSFLPGLFLFMYSMGSAQSGKENAVFSQYNIIQYGAIPDGKTNNTVAIQQAVDDCHSHGGGRIIIPTGRFVTGTIRLYSNMNPVSYTHLRAH